MRLLNIKKHLYFLFLLIPPAAASSEELLIADFEKFPINKFNGSIGVYGAMTGSGPTTERWHGKDKSFKLIFSKELPNMETEHYVKKDVYDNRIKNTETISNLPKVKKLDWAVLALEMGPIIDMKTTPVTIKPFDASGYKYLSFWVAGKRGNENFMIYLRDSRSDSYDPQIKIKPGIVVQKKWKKVLIDLRKYEKEIELSSLVQIGIGFGKTDGNRVGNIIYVDDFMFEK